MCVIVVKNKGVKMPSMDILKKCFDHNPDGAGYMYTNGDGFVHIRKGFMSWKEFKNSIGKLKKQIDIKKEALVMHFRISTQAGVNKQCCHPYPLSKNMDDLKKLSVKSKIGVAHNGIIELTSEYEYYGYSTWGNKSQKKIDYNDTMKFITDYLSLIIKNDKFYNDNDTLTLIERLCGSKLAIMDSTGHITLVGKFEEKDGVYFSNLNHEIVRTNTWKTTKYDYSDWKTGYGNGYVNNCCDESYGYEDDEGFDVDDFKEKAHYYSIPIQNAYEFEGVTYIMDYERAYITSDTGYINEDLYEVDCHTLEGEPMVAYFTLDKEDKAVLEAICEY